VSCGGTSRSRRVARGLARRCGARGRARRASAPGGGGDQAGEGPRMQCGGMFGVLARLRLLRLLRLGGWQGRKLNGGDATTCRLS
jgi:hypothetical protein